MSARSLPLLPIALWVSVPAWAGLDGQAPPLPPSDGEVSDPALSWSAQPMPEGAGAFDAAFDYQSAPLRRITASGERLTELGDVVSLRLGGRYALSDRIDVGASLPLVLNWRSDLVADGAVPNLGDARIAGHFALTQPTSPLHVALVPQLRLPTGGSAVNLGDKGLGGSLVAAITGAFGPVHASANLGGEWRTFDAVGNAEPGAGLLGSVAVGVQASPDLAFQAEWRGAQRLGSVEVPDAPDTFLSSARGGEAMLSGRGRLNEHFWMGGGIGLGAPWGFNASPFRAFLGAGGSFGGRADPTAATEDPGRGRRADRDDDDGTVPIVVNVQNESGVPLDAELRVDGGRPVQATAGRAQLSLPPGEHLIEVQVEWFGRQARRVRLVSQAREVEEVRFILLPKQGDGSVYVDLGSPEDRPVDNATVSIDGRPVGESASGGGVLVGGLEASNVLVEARAQSFRDGSLNVATSEDPEPVAFLLARERGAVQLVVTDTKDQPISDVRARFLGPDRLGPYALGARGERTFVLRPGSWQVLVSHPDFGLQQRGVDLLDEDSELATVRFVLRDPEAGGADLSVRVVDPAGLPIPDAEVHLDGTSLGRTSTAGSLTLEDLAEGPRELVVSGPELETTQARIDLHEGLQEALLVARWQAGATLFRARRPDGMASDASVRGRGPANLPATPLGKDGVARTRLQAGSWDLLFSSPSLGLAEQAAAIPSESGHLTVVDAMLGAPDAPGTTLALDVIDPEKRPVRGAVVRLDGEVVGRTASTGTLSITDAGSGSRGLEVRAEPYAAASTSLRLAGDRVSERVALSWAPGATRIAVRSGGAPIDGAVVRIGGPRFVPPTPVGADGRRLFALGPGTWQVLVSAPDKGLEQASLQIPDRPQLNELIVDLDPIGSDAAQAIFRVQGPDGLPVEEAKVKLDDRAPVEAPGGFASFTDVGDGPHTLEITAPDFEPVTLDGVDVEDGVVQQRVVPMTWRPREIEIRVSGPDGKPVDARIIATSPETREPIDLGGDGRTTLALDPRRWELVVRAEGLRVARVVIDEGTEARPIDLTLRPARVRVQGAVLTTSEPIYFETGKSALGPFSHDLLDEVADTVLAHPELVRVEISGHTDSTGSVPVNMRLSRERAQAVEAALVQRGVAPERLDAQGYGPTRPTASNETDAGRAQNRRVEFVSETGD